MRGLPHCRDDSAQLSLPSCTGADLDGRAAALEGRLCKGIRALLSSTCAQLSNVTYVYAAIGDVGMVPDSRRERLYGDAARYMVKSPIPNAGLWQDPR